MWRMIMTANVLRAYGRLILKSRIRIQQTKGGLLEDVCRWVLENSDFKWWWDDKNVWLLWIRGEPDKGKTMLVCGIIDELRKKISSSELLLFLFCQDADAHINNATSVLRSLIRQLVDEQPLLISHIRKRYDQYEGTNSWYTVSKIFYQHPGRSRHEERLLYGWRSWWVSGWSSRTSQQDHAKVIVILLLGLTLCINRWCRKSASQKSMSHVGRSST